MTGLKISRAHSNEWYDNLAQVQEGYYYPWNSILGEMNGEEAYLDLIRQHTDSSTRILEVGCGHGEAALDLASSCQSILAYDRVPNYIELANAGKRKAGTTNVEFICHDATESEYNAVRLPAEDDSIDFIICRRGPLHWIEDARRVCRPGAILIQLCPMEEAIPAWSSKLPKALHYENSGRHTGTGSIHHSVENRLHQAGLTLDSAWGFDIAEIFPDPRELYKVLTWGLPVEKIPAYEDIEYKFTRIYQTYGEKQGIVLRHCRYLWKAIVD